MSASRTLRLLIVDDHPLFRVGLWHLLNQLAEEIQIVEASNVGQALEHLLAEPAFDIILVDLMMPGMSGFDDLRTICDKTVGTPVVVVSVRERAEDVKSAITAGARGYIPKSSSPEVLVQALKLVLSGGVYLPPHLLGVQPGMGVTSASGTAARDAFPAKGVLGRLTPRQREVLALLAEGKSNKEIASELGLAAGTVKIHVSSIFKALNVNNRTLAVIAANELRGG
ncbi:MAG: response regulator [Kiloniellales bacterium]